MKREQNAIRIRLGERGAEEAALDNDIAVVVDVLRASSTIITAIDNGALSIVPVLTVNQAREIARKTPNSILAGERKALPIRGFLLGNSPLEYTPEIVRGKNIVLTTTNCTRILERFRRLQSCSEVLIGAFLNATSVAGAARKLGKEKNRGVSLIQAGVGGKQSQDDLTCAELIKTMIEARRERRSTLTLRRETNLFIYAILSNTTHGKYLMKLGFERDVDYCSRLDETATVPKLCKADGTIAKIVTLESSREGTGLPR
nr:2-phosphosulfolactate phosphatase [Candidatus Njordarchaeota archaeon]